MLITNKVIDDIFTLDIHVYIIIILYSPTTSVNLMQPFYKATFRLPEY